VDADKLLDAMSAADIRALVDALARRGSLEPGNLATEEELLAHLPVGLRNFAGLARNALAEHLEVDAADIAIAPIEGDAPRVVVALATANALKSGCWDEILSPDLDGQLTASVGDRTFDTRHGMTWASYRALVQWAERLGRYPLPDSGEAAGSNDQPWTCTLLTGDEPEDGRVPFAFVNDGRPGRSWGGSDYRGGLRFRPAIVLTAAT
jgi:hypothetical protein